MAKILDMPKLSPTMEEGVLAAWHKKEGDTVEVDDLLAEVETDKATMEFRSYDNGTMLKILVPEGSNVVLGQPVAIMGNPGDDITALISHSGGGKPAKAQAPSGDEILNLLQALNREQGKTIIMVTHDPHAADRATRTLHLEKGQLVREVAA